MEKKKAKGQIKEETENSLFHQLLAQTTDVEEDPVCLKLHMSIVVIDSLCFCKYSSVCQCPFLHVCVLEDFLMSPCMSF